MSASTIIYLVIITFIAATFTAVGLALNRHGTKPVGFTIWVIASILGIVLAFDQLKSRIDSNLQFDNTKQRLEDIAKTALLIDSSVSNAEKNLSLLSDKYNELSTEYNDQIAEMSSKLNLMSGSLDTRISAANDKIDKLNKSILEVDENLEETKRGLNAASGQIGSLVTDLTRIQKVLASQQKSMETLKLNTQQQRDIEDIQLDIQQRDEQYKKCVETYTLANAEQIIKYVCHH